MSLLDMALTADNEVGADGLPLGARWEGGFTWQPRQCGTIVGRNDCAPYTAGTYRAGSNSRRVHQPVIVDAVNDCPSTLASDWDTERQTAADMLAAAEAVAVEQELWDGTIARAALLNGDTAYAKNLWLTRKGVATDVTPTPGTGVSPTRALGILEDFLADHGFGGTGMIHMRPSVLAHLPWDTRIVGRQLFSPRNTLLVPGSGYTGNGPSTQAADTGATRTVTDGSLTSGSANLSSASATFTAADVGARVTGTGIPAGTAIASVTSSTVAVMTATATSTGTGRTVTLVDAGSPSTPAAGTTWMFATGRVTYRHGEVVITPDNEAEAVNRATNTLAVTAQRATAATWDLCAVGAVLVSYPSAALDGGSP